MSSLAHRMLLARTLEEKNAVYHAGIKQACACATSSSINLNNRGNMQVREFQDQDYLVNDYINKSQATQMLMQTTGMPRSVVTSLLRGMLLHVTSVDLIKAHHALASKAREQVAVYAKDDQEAAAAVDAVLTTEEEDNNDGL